MLSWLPHRVRERIGQWRLRAATAGLARTPPVACRPAGAATEVHQLVCTRDVRLTVLSLKSLLRFYGDRLGVALSDDGSLTAADRAWIEWHIPGCRWVPLRLPEEVVRTRLGDHPHLRQLYASGFVFARKLIHPLLAARADKVILLDSDTAFVSRPDQLGDWIGGDGAAPLYLKDKRDEAREVPPEVVRAFDAFAPLSGVPGWRIGHYFFNAGLLAFAPARMRLDVADRCLGWSRTLGDDLRQGVPKIWFGPWTQEQTAYLAMYAAASPRAVPFGDGYRIGAGPGGVFHHFLRAGLESRPGLSILGAVVAQLRTPAGGRAGPVTTTPATP